MNSHSVSLQRLIPDALFVNCGDIVAYGITSDSRIITPGQVFIAVAGTRANGHDHVASAITRGASAVVVSAPVPGISTPCCVVPCTATAFARISAALQMENRSPAVCAGVTGTNGKTTTTWMLRSILQAARFRCGLIGTIECSDGVNSEASSMTTPPADILAQQMRRMVDQGSSHCVMEISSHALHQKRCQGFRLSTAAITNITQDHFDYHGTAANYIAAKCEIASLLHADAPLLINLNDAGCRSVLGTLQERCSVVTTGINCEDAELRARILRQTHRSQHVRFSLAQGDARIRIRLIGRHNAENALIAAGLAEQLGVSLSDIVAGLEQLTAVPGRLERIDEGQPFQVLVDYAHTADALSRAIATVRRFVPGRLICVFGAGGDRDREKRAAMGNAASEADICIVTSDNPRSEDPSQIIENILIGTKGCTRMVVQVERRDAISHAFEIAEPGDVVLIAGKGHEQFQESNSEKRPFDDRIVARQLLKAQFVTAGGMTYPQYCA